MEDLPLKLRLPLILALLGTLTLLAGDNVQEPSPVPEPSTMLVMGAGLATVVFFGWKCNQEK